MAEVSGPMNLTPGNYAEGLFISEKDFNLYE